MTNGITVYILLWFDETESWRHFINFVDDPSIGEDYVDYYIVVENNSGIILSDTFDTDRQGCLFDTFYDEELWR